MNIRQTGIKRTGTNPLFILAEFVCGRCEILTYSLQHNILLMQICWCCLATKTLNLNNRNAVWQLVARPTTAFPKQNNNLLGVNSTYVRMCVCIFWGCICLFSVLSIVNKILLSSTLSHFSYFTDRLLMKTQEQCCEVTRQQSNFTTLLFCKL